MASRAWLLERDGAILGSATVCRAPLVGADGADSAAFLTDLAVAPGSDAARVLSPLVSAARDPWGPASEVRTLSAACNATEGAALRALGFREVGAELAMVLPFAAEAREATSAEPRQWYTLAESVVGL